MKKSIYLLTAITAMFAAGCSSSADKDKKNNEIIVEISSEPGTCYMWHSPEPVSCMQMREDKPDAEFASVPLYTIKGFEYESGYDWKLKVRKDSIANPPADASSIEYTLIKVLSKTAETK